MVNRVCESLGAPLPHPSSFSPSTVHSLSSLATFVPSSSSSPTPSTATPPPVIYAFPPPSALTPASTDPLLRQLGFGYRAPFIEWSANYLVDSAAEANLTPGEYLESLRQGKFEGGLQGAREKLMEFKGVGRKVADCVALFSLGWKEVVPVDTHVFQVGPCADGRLMRLLAELRFFAPTRSPFATTRSPPRRRRLSPPFCTTASAHACKLCGALTPAGRSKSSSSPTSRRPPPPLRRRSG